MSPHSSQDEAAKQTHANRTTALIIIAFFGLATGCVIAGVPFWIGVPILLALSWLVKREREKRAGHCRG